VLLAIVVAAWVVQSFFLNYTVDDAFITFRYSRNFAQGLGFVFNPGERVEGFTNLLWTLCCAIPFRLGLDVVWFSKIVLMLLSAASLATVVLLVRRLAPNARWWLPFIPAAMLALHTSYTLYAVNGIETQLFVFLLLVSIFLAAGEFKRGGWLSAVFLGLLFLTRPDGFMFGSLCFGLRLVWGKRDRSLAVWAAIFAAFVGGLTAFRLAYFGHPFPNTYYAKAAGSLEQRVSMWGSRYFRDIFRVPANWFYLLPPLTVVLAWKRLPTFARGLCATPYIYLAYVLYIGGDVNFPHFRFLLHVLPLLAIVPFVVLGETSLARRKAPASRPGLGAWIVVVSGAIAVLLQLGHTRTVWRSMNESAESAGFRYLSTTPLAGGISIYPEIAESLKNTVPAGASVVMQDVGAIPFYSGVVTIDIIGLVNADLAHLYYREGYTDYHRGLLPPQKVMRIDAAVRDYIINQRKADFVLYHVDSGDARELRYSFHWHELAFDPRFQELYEPIGVFRYPRTGRVDHLLFRRRSL
jgi:hypothetical protein